MSLEQMEDRELATKIVSKALKLERLIDYVGNTPIRHAMSEHIVAITRLAQNGASHEDPALTFRLPPLKFPPL